MSQEEILESQSICEVLETVLNDFSIFISNLQADINIVDAFILEAEQGVSNLSNPVDLLIEKRSKLSNLQKTFDQNYKMLVQDIKYKVAKLTDEYLIEKRINSYEDRGLLTKAKTWVQPKGSQDAYQLGSLVIYNNKIWVSIVDANVWEPGVTGWRVSNEFGEEVVSEWIQPLGAHDSYNIGATVIHNGKKWIATIGNNVWEPGVYGWNEVV